MSQQTASYSTRPPMWGLASMCGGEIDRRIQAARSGQVKKGSVLNASEELRHNRFLRRYHLPPD